METNTATQQKPEYITLLNDISLGESAAGVYLEAWANVTPSADLACTLRFVAAREKSHGEVFARRLCELGYAVEKKPDPRRAALLAKFSNPDITDLEKTGDPKDLAGDPFADMRRRLAEGEFDPMTANLMSWYIAEEMDSLRRLREAYDCVRGACETSAQPACGPSADAEAMMACMTAGFARLEKSLEKLAKASK